MAVAVLLCGIAYVITMGDFNAGLQVLTSMGMFYLPVVFTLWAVVGLAVRNRSLNFRLVTNLAISSLVIAAITEYFTLNLPKSATAGASLFYVLVMILWGACITGGLVTYLYFVRPPRPKI